MGVVNGSNSQWVEGRSNTSGSNGIVMAVAQMISLHYRCLRFYVKPPLNAQPRFHPRSSCRPNFDKGKPAQLARLTRLMYVYVCICMYMYLYVCMRFTSEEHAARCTSGVFLQATWRARLHQASVTQSRAGYRACRLHCAELNPQPRSKPAEAMAQKMNFVST